MSIYIIEMRSMWWFLSCLTFTTCYPTGSPEAMSDPVLSDERKFVNGTVVGTYNYKDKEGNPIHVKYYADDSNYGVELKSFKVISSSGKPLDALPYIKDFKPYKLENLPSPDSKTLPEVDVFPTVKDSDDFPTGKRSKNPGEDTKSKRYKGDKFNPDFETYYQNDILEPTKCGKSKVRVYYDKERRIRNVDNFEADKYCEQF